MEKEIAFNPESSVPNSYRKAYPKVCNSPDKKDTLIRTKINLRSLLKALALHNGKRVVSESEFQEFLELADYMNFNYNPIR